MPDFTPDNTTWAWAAAFVAAVVSWFARGLGFGRQWGRVETELRLLDGKVDAVMDRLDKMDTRMNAHFDRRD
jgi:hypothetical protein